MEVFLYVLGFALNDEPRAVIFSPTDRLERAQGHHCSGEFLIEGFWGLGLGFGDF